MIVRAKNVPFMMKKLENEDQMKKRVLFIKLNKVDKLFAKKLVYELP